MSKKMTITLSDIAEKHFHNVNYGLEVPEKTNPNQSDVINHCMEECLAFEEITDDQITNYLVTNYPEQYKAWIEKYNIKQY